MEPFDLIIGTSKQFPIVHAVISYYFPYNHKHYLLLIYNALHVKSMDNNIIPPFILIESIIKVNGTPKIHIYNTSFEDNTIHTKEAIPWITLKLWRVL